jgi:RNA polymerase sigma-54 factor
MSSVELGEYLRDCLDSNPFLMEDESQRCRHPLDLGVSQHISADNLLAEYDRKRPLAQKLAHRQDGDSSLYGKNIEALPSLNDYLADQAHQVLRGETDRRIVDFLIGNIDDNGYLCCSMEEAALACGCPVDCAERVLLALQENISPGIAARNLRECLSLQLNALAESSVWPSHLPGADGSELAAVAALGCKGGTESGQPGQQDSGAITAIAAAIVEGHLEDLASGCLERIANSLEVPVEDVQKAVDLLRGLDPKPGRQFLGHNEAMVWPEVLARKDADGNIIVSLCEFCLPKLVIDSSYIDMMQEQKLNPNTKRYLRNEYKAATGLLKAVEMRYLSLRNVSVAIAANQLGFFEHGISHLAPLTMAAIADETGLSESTVCRVANGHYMQTPHGLFELKAFFSTSLKSRGDGLREDGDKVSNYSQTAIMCALKQLVEQEDSGMPLSDSQICSCLQDELNVTISRRTVNKYRTRMGIPSHTLRRRHS